MKFYIAELVATGIAFLCALTNHVGACFVWRKLMPLDLWASNIMDRRGVNQLHRFNPPLPPPLGAACQCQVRGAFSSGVGAATYRYCPQHGMRLDV